MYAIFIFQDPVSNTQTGTQADSFEYSLKCNDESQL